MIEKSRIATVSQGTDGYRPQWSEWSRRVAIVGLLIALVYALTLLAPVMRLLGTTLLLSLVMHTPSRLIALYLRAPNGGAVTLSYGLALVLLAAGLGLIVPATVAGANTLTRDAAQRTSQLQDALRRYTPDQAVVMVLGVRVDLHALVDPVRNMALGTDQTAAQGTTPISTGDLRQLVTSVTELLASAVSGIAGFVSTIVMALFLSFLILLDLPNLERALHRWIPPAYHRESTLLTRQIGYVWNGFFRGQALIAFIIAILTWLQLTVMGVQHAVVVAVFGGLISLIPTLGGILALVPIAVISLLQGSSVFTGLPNGTFAILAVAVNLVISQIIWNVVAPKILGNAVNVPLPIIIVGLFVGAALGGILGAFLITPVIGTVRVVTHYVITKIERQDPFPGQ